MKKMVLNILRWTLILIMFFGTILAGASGATLLKSPVGLTLALPVFAFLFVVFGWLGDLLEEQLSGDSCTKRVSTMKIFENILSYLLPIIFLLAALFYLASISIDVKAELQKPVVSEPIAKTR